jgi:hypothetical protein
MSGPGEYLLDKLQEGKKNDAGKLRMDLIPGYPLMRLAEVYTIGAAKYEDDNWRKGISYKRIFAAMLRHAWKWFMGEKFDLVDGQHHLSSVAWCAFTLMEYEITHPEFDDRPKTVATHENLAKEKNLPNEEWVPCHCSICNKMFMEVPDLKILRCLNCGSSYAHCADATCKIMSYREWKDDETTSEIANSIPSIVDYSDDYIVW